MSRFVKSEKGYEKSFETDWKKLKQGLRKKSIGPGFLRGMKEAVAHSKKSFKLKNTNDKCLAKQLGISHARGMEAVIKAQLISAILKASQESGLTHAMLAQRSGLPRSAVTGILSGSLQKVTIERVFKLIEAAKLVAEIKVKKAAA